MMQGVVSKCFICILHINVHFEGVNNRNSYKIKLFSGDSDKIKRN